MSKQSPRTNLQEKISYACENCGNGSPKWEGRCPYCNNWNTIVKVHGRNWDSQRAPGPIPTPCQELLQVSIQDLPRLQVSSSEVNRVLGGGIVLGSVGLIAGDPGIGKSTLLLKVASDVAENTGKVLYVTGEESAAQVKIRADRLKIPGKGLFLLQSTALDEVLDHINSIKPALVVVDSIQTIHGNSSDSGPGTITQIRECTRILMGWAKTHSVPMMLSGHVTKGGDIAGPRALEHMVDVVLYLEGESISSWRLLRGIKNRFGPTNEVGVFEMTAYGLTDVVDPSKSFLSQRRDGAVGSVVIATMEGRRPLLAEVQALTNPSALSSPRRVATGIDFNRMSLICSVLTRHTDLSLSSEDVVVNITGGLRVSEPAADLGIALAIASSLRNNPVQPNFAVVGEVGLSGEIRSVPQLDWRLAEIGRMGIRHCLLPSGQGIAETDRVGVNKVIVDTLVKALDVSLADKTHR